MMHLTNEGEPKIVCKCTYPLTAKAVVKLIVTDLAVIVVTAEGLLLQEIAPGLTVEGVQSVTEPKLIISPNLKEIQL
jgi:acyl CoA:acetate/3-ketoacid CoA transferase beta subunit